MKRSCDETGPGTHMHAWPPYILQHRLQDTESDVLEGCVCRLNLAVDLVGRRSAHEGDRPAPMEDLQQHSRANKMVIQRWYSHYTSLNREHNKRVCSNYCVLLKLWVRSLFCRASVSQMDIN